MLARRTQPVAVFLITCSLLVGAEGHSRQARERPGASSRDVTAFLSRLQQAVARDDRPAVANMIDYPAVVFAGGLRVPLKTADEVIQRYDLVFTSELKSMIAAAEDADCGAQDDVSLTADTVAIVEGLIELKVRDGGVKIAVITVPTAAPADAAAPGAAASSRRSSSDRAHEPRRIFHRPGRPPAQVMGSLAPGQTDRYVVWAGRGELLDARIQGVAENTVVLQVMKPDGAPLDERAGAGARAWTGRAPAAADYRIDVVSRATKRGALPYTLVVTVRR